MRLTYGQKRALALRRVYRSIAVAIYPPFGKATVDELDAEFQKGLDVSYDIHQLMLARKKEEGMRLGLMVNCPNCNDTGRLSCPKCRAKEDMR